MKNALQLSLRSLLRFVVILHGIRASFDPSITSQRMALVDEIDGGNVGRRQIVPPLANQTAAVDEEPLLLHGSDHPGLILVTNSLNGNNYLSWRRSMLIALGAKTKLGFINGKIEMPEIDSPKFEQWKKVDCMVTSWLLNSISRDIVDGFIYAETAKELWDDLAQRFGQCNGPQLYQLQREIASINQGNSSVVVYFTKLKKLWDEYNNLAPTPVCHCGVSTCGILKQLNEREMNTKLIQFLMGLNESFEQVRSQILLMDPLPDINKAYSLMLRIEKQRAVQQVFSDGLDGAAMIANTNTSGRGRGLSYRSGNATGNPMGNWQGGRGRGVYRRTREEKAKLTCSHCQGTGHEIHECFKLIGYPEWYKKPPGERGRPYANLTDISNAPEIKSSIPRIPAPSLGGSLNSTQSKAATVDMSGMIQQEIAKFMAKMGAGDVENSANFAHFAGYTGPED